MALQITVNEKMEEFMSKDCCSSDKNIMLLACSGGSNVGQLFYHFACKLYNC
jgi:uncharacterized metal-binding protein